MISSLSSGGAERVLSFLANQLCQRHDVVIATFSGDAPFYPLDRRVTHMRLHLLTPSANPAVRLAGMVRRVWRLYKLMREYRPDAVLSFMTHTNLTAILSARLAGVRIVVSERIAHDFYTSAMVRILRRRLYPLAHCVLTQTEADAAYYNTFVPTRVLPNPVAVSPTQVRAKTQTVLGVGRLEAQKGFEDLIIAFASLARPGWRLVIVGEGRQQEELEALIARYPASDIVLAGRQEDMAPWYAEASVFVLSSRREGFPNALLEAMAFGCACVAYACPYGPEELMTHEKEGLLVPANDRLRLQEALGRVMDSAVLRNRLAQSARQRAERYAPDRVIPQWEAVLCEVADG